MGISKTHQRGFVFSLEDEEIMLDTATGMAQTLHDASTDAWRLIDSSSVLHDTADACDTIQTASPAECSLLELVGDACAAGEDVEGVQIVPNKLGVVDAQGVVTESWVGKSFALEATTLREKAAALGKAIAAIAQRVWEAIEKFFSNIFGAIPRLRRQIASLQKSFGELGNNPTPTKPVRLPTNNNAYYLDGSRVNDGKEFVMGMQKTLAATKYVFEEYSDWLGKKAKQIADIVSHADPSAVDETVAKVMDIVLTDKTPAIPDSKRDDQGMYTIEMGVATLGNGRLIARHYTGDERGLAGIQRLQKCSVRYRQVFEIDRPDIVSIAPLSTEEAKHLLASMAEMVTILEKYSQGKGKTTLRDIRANMAKVAVEATARYEKLVADSDGDQHGVHKNSASYRLAEALAQFDIVFGTWINNPSVVFYREAIKVLRAGCFYARQSLVVHNQSMA